MKVTKLFGGGAVALIAGLVLSSALTVPPAGVEVGESLSYEFSTPMVNGMGVGSLEELRGKPVLVEFWGTR
jgi:hypothetical protein